MTDPGRVSVVVLTTGNRPAELHAAAASALDQTGVDVELVVVANGVPAARLGLPDDERVTIVETGENLGVPGGRNVGAANATGAFIAFLDDDARLLDTGVLARAASAMAADPKVGVVALRLVDEHGQTAHRHVPRVGARGAGRSGPVAEFLGGACVVRASAFQDVGGYAGEFRYAMEETDLSLRLVDRGWRICYHGTPAVYHPATEPSRHPDAARRTMRNRVWLAHRNLPAAVGVIYVATWLTISTIRNPRLLRTSVAAIVEGWRTRPGPRCPIRWATVWRLTRLGRPPIV